MLPKYEIVNPVIQNNMKKEIINTIEQFEHLLHMPDTISASDIRSYFEHSLGRRISDKSAIAEFDRKIGSLNNLVFSVTTFFKQNYLFAPDPIIAPTRHHLYTKQEVAVKYRVSVRTINNWIASGLKTIEIGGVLRICESDLTQFATETTRKKLKWRSIRH